MTSSTVAPVSNAPATDTSTVAPAAPTTQQARSTTTESAGGPVNTAPAPQPSTADREARLEIRAVQQQVKQLHEIVKTVADNLETRAAQAVPAAAATTAPAAPQSNEIRQLQHKVDLLHAVILSMARHTAWLLQNIPVKSAFKQPEEERIKELTQMQKLIEYTEKVPTLEPATDEAESAKTCQFQYSMPSALAPVQH